VKGEIEDHVKRELSKRSPLELMVFQSVMPAIINVITDFGSASFFILGDGSIDIEAVSSKPDLTLRADFMTLVGLYHARAKEGLLSAEREGKVRIEVHTIVGKIIEDRLRKLFESMP